MQALINIYETFSEALHTIQELEAVHVVPTEISLIVKNGKPKHLTIDVEPTKKTKAKKGKPVKAAPKAPQAPDGPIDHDLKAQFFDSLNLNDIAGIGQIIGAGWMLKDAIERTPTEDLGLVSTEAKGLLDSMTENGLTHEHAETYVEGIKRGATLIAVRTSPAFAKDAERVMREEHKPMDPHMRGHHYWTSDRDPKEDKNTKTNRLISMLISAVR